MKICNKCKQNKELNLFPKRSKSKDGYDTICKECKNILLKQYYQINTDKIQQYYFNNKEKFIERNKKYVDTKKKWRDDNKEHLKEYYNNWREQNIEWLSQKQREYSKSRQKIRNAKDIERRKNDPQFRIACALRGRIGMLLKKNKTSRTIELLGCSLEHFKNHLESKFTLKMNWDNYGSYWEVDHIIPCSSFDLTYIEQQKQCFHYTNTQPLTKLENRTKSNKML
jgi:hypothetical protein